MALQTSSLNLPFMGLDQKADPFKVAPGKFLALKNIIPIKGGEGGVLFQKRNGYSLLPSLPDTTFTYTTTFAGNLLAMGTTLQAYSSSSQTYLNMGNLIPIQLSTLPLVRTSANQSQVDTAVASNGLVCTVFTNTSPSTTYNYVIIDSLTGQNIVQKTVIASASESPRVFLLWNYFVILYSQSTNLKYISIPVNNPLSPAAAVTLVTNYAVGALTQPAFDGAVFNNNLYVAYNATDGGGAIRATYLNSFLVRQTAATGVSIAAAKAADMVSVAQDLTTANIWFSFYKTSTTAGYAVCTDQVLNVVTAATQFINTGTILNLTSSGNTGRVTLFYEIANTYGYGASLPTNIINRSVVTQAGAVGTLQIARSVGLASKAFLIGQTAYMLVAYSSAYQPSYFLMDQLGNIVAKLAYSNGGGYLTLGLPSVTVTGSVAQVGYLIRDLLEPTNKSQSPTSTTPVFTQTGINLASFDFTSDHLNSAEIGSNLHLSGGMVWTYDGTQIVEQGFHVWPDNVVVTTATGSGSLIAQDYFYQAVYEWTDNQGNIHRSAPSLAAKQTTTTASSTNTIKVPTLRLTYKTLVKIILYRWSTAQQTYYQVTSLTSPTLNDKTVDNVTITDTLADSAIVGNSIIYTTGGVVEDIGPPAANVVSLFKSRLFLIDAEDTNLLWFSKQVIEGTPVEMSDLLTVYVAPTIGAQGSTGGLKCLSAMDDKFILYKQDAIYYMVGSGPDNTGANNDFSDPIFITSTIGCSTQNSIVFMPQGLIFKSDKGFWLLGRDLSTTYIGAAVENFNSANVLSAISIPETNQVRFTLDNNITLMYDYFFGIWSSFQGTFAISSTLFQRLHTFIDSFGRVFQESPGLYLDGSDPVLMSFITGWFNLAGLQGFQRAYSFTLLGTYLSPHQLNIQIGFNYRPASQTVLISPTNYNGAYGSDALYGDSETYGGNSNVEQWDVSFEQQKCQSFQIQLAEVYDASFGVQSGAGFTLSGINLIVANKKPYVQLKAEHRAG